ncbi:D-threo-aldose 1-dehydrogenase [Streptomyces zhaozhouensis]|uniref:D-threo-aldose 1-dehydrogenase n=1 Tax=Streptomyces zhaozhouensis TaxID=1300267 RepID=A0A286E467_9ACTN|nr:aldo/keto reductase [Streptomyces zhaozhouensis]SOD65696.1 D-threo-aldose 1-dehydrogenase [Streptomyces zhaozhouensis]
MDGTTAIRAAATVPLGRTGLEVSRLGLGLASVGGLFRAVDEGQALRTVRRARALGVRLFDTAPVYGYGLSETRAGLALRDEPRDGYVLCTKVGRLIEPGGPDTQPIWADPPPGLGARLDYSYGAVVRSLTESLERLGLERVDVLHVHDPEQDFAGAVGETYRALADLRAADTVRAVSIGVNHADVAVRYLREAPAPGPDCVMLAGRWNLVDQSGLDELLPLCQERGVAVLAAGVLHSGLLADPDAHPDAPAAAAGRARAVHEVCARHGVPPVAAALQFPFGHPAVTAVVVGARTPEEITRSARLLAHPLPAAVWADLRAAGVLPAGWRGVVRH